ncbi:ecotropic viral integration site 5 ortholog [Cololabis saira]|uniref:ecotropic viral integration site 5 ortholog n=1 Tax=Cololabis saira TaxID=129043 RepID=UPI002AD3AAB9|nr:ecotropic viral integration site 5 ortholog [Cololabis saira]
MMLNQSSQAQRNLSEEDNSGSDAGSEISLEPETDRFGFIVTNGSAAGSVGPSPELVRQREAKWINLIGQWERILLKKSSKVKLQCQKGIPASLRAKCWPLLCAANEKMKQNKNLYESLDSQPGLQNWVDIIERDLDRQFPFHEMFLSKDGHGQRGLFRVLKAYTQYQPEEGYCQAQGPVAAVLLMNMPAEEAFWCLVQISEQYLPGYYSPMLEGVLFDAAMLTWVLKRMCPAAHKHLQQHNVEPLMFATDWLMCLFTRHLPFNTLLRVWDLFFCYGVRVLLQVAVVLVRRVLGRAEQRKQCQGQMETLERLRGVREQVQEEAEAFIAEVCSVQLSSKDLEKRTEKELGKWRKDRPSSTFDPRHRCHGYRMAWMKVQDNEQEREKKEREKGNLAVPLGRSASTLSLSPSLLHKKWRKGGKVNTGDWVSGNKVQRHFSMGGKEDWGSSTDFNFKKVQDLKEEEDIISERHRTQNESKVAEEPKQDELLGEPKTKNTPIEHIGQKVIEEQAEKLDQTLGNTLQPTELSSPGEHKERLETVCQVQLPEDQSHGNDTQETEVKDINDETDPPVEDKEHTTAVEDNSNEIQVEAPADINTELETRAREEPTIQCDMKPTEDTETENVQLLQVATVTEASDTETLNSDGDGDIVASTVKYQDPTTDTQQEREEQITKTEEDAFGEKHHSTESLVQTEKKEMLHTQTKTETDIKAEIQEQTEETVAAKDDITQTNTEKPIDSELEANAEEKTLIESPPDSIQQKEDTDLITDTKTEVSQDVINESNEKTGVEPVHEKEETAEMGKSEACICDRTNVEETQVEEETADSVALTQDEALNHTTEPEPEPDHNSISDMQTPELPLNQATSGNDEEVKQPENVKGDTAGEDDVFFSAEGTDRTLADSNKQDQDDDPALIKDPSEPRDSSLEQACGHRGSRSSGDFCVRRSSYSRGSRMTRRLSEDLFTTPQKTEQSQPPPNHPESQHRPVNAAETAPDVTPAGEGTKDEAIRQAEQPDTAKRFGLLRKLRGEQPKNTKTEATAKMQVPKILIQDFSDGTGAGKTVDMGEQEKLNSKERRKKRRDSM